jgi:valacyclovir hydrolase
MPFVETATGARLHYEDRGTGTPIIALHGLLGTAQTQLPQVVEWLSARYRVLGPTLRGYGQSTPKPRDFPFDFYHRDARDVIAFMDSLGIAQAHLMGYSDGGETALVAAGLAPERFLSVIAWGAVGYYGPAMRQFAQRTYPGTWITDEDRRLHGIADPDAFALGWVTAVKHMIDAGGDVSLSLGQNMRMPLLIMLGERDYLNPPEHAQKLLERTPNGRLAMFKTAHPIHDEDWEAFQNTVEAFLQSADQR